VTDRSAAPATLLDTARFVDTPEGCRLGLRVAGPVSRARAWLIDFLIRAAIYMLAAQVLGLLGKFGAGIMFMLVFGLEWLYPTLFEAYRHGATPGKRMCKLAVLHEDGTPIGLAASFLRNTLRAVDFLPVFYGVGIIAMFLTRDYQRLGDLAAGTVVVYVDEPPAPTPDAVNDNEAPPIPLSIAEQRAVIEFTLRAGRLTPERAAELARLAAPLTEGMPADAARARLMRIGRFLLGRR
jgi:uncharacterized RDD family membrane protein YckC